MAIIKRAELSDAEAIVELEALLLREIMDRTNLPHFIIDQEEIRSNVQEFIVNQKMWFFTVYEADFCIGFVGICEACALYAHGSYGIITELFVRADSRSKQIGKQLLEKVVALGRERQWKRLEVTTPPLPAFQRSLDFYLGNQFAISGGRKLKLDL